MQITKAGKSDIHRIIKLAWDIWPEWYWPVIGPEQIAFMLENIYQPDLVEMQMESGQQFFILTLHQRDAGFLSLRNERLEKLYLHPQQRGNGFGMAMLKMAESEARLKEYPFLELNVNRFNPALNFYLRQGFDIIRQEDIPFGPFFLIDFILRKKL